MHETLKPLVELRPLRNPVLIAAFTGWGDMAGSAIATMDHLREQWNATPIAEIEPESYFDFTVQRPRVRLEDGERMLDWPEIRFYVAQPDGPDHDFVLLSGAEPSLRWRTFTGVVEELMRAVGATTSITIGAQPAAMPHTRPMPVTLSASDTRFEEQFGLKSPVSRYQGPTGIVGVLNLHHRSLDWRNASLWAMAPHYLTMGANPNAAIALVKTLDRGFHTNTSIEALEQRADVFAGQIREAMRSFSEADDYVRQLEEQYDANQPSLPASTDAEGEEGGQAGLPAADDLLDDLERFLRDRQQSDQ